MNKNIITLMLAATIAAACALPAMAHDAAIELRTFADIDGDGIGDSVSTLLDATRTVEVNAVPGAMVMGPPVSPKQSCNLCHDYDSITSAYHFQLGADEMVDATGDGFKDDFGDVVAADPNGPLHKLPTLTDITSPGQFGGW